MKFQPHAQTSIRHSEMLGAPRRASSASSLTRFGGTPDHALARAASEGGKGDGPGRSSFEARKGAHLRMTGEGGSAR